MEKIKHLSRGDKIAIVSLSSGILGEPFVKHELDLGIKRMKEFGLTPVFMPHALKGLDYISSHPKERAEDLIAAFEDKEINGIICAIGGVDAYKTFPYLVNNNRLKDAVKNNPKLFLGYSDTTNHHFILNNLGLPTFYGQAFITDLAEFEDDMLDYSKKHFEMLFSPKQTYEIEPSPVWFNERTDFSPSAVGTKRISHESSGYELLQGTHSATGKLLGGCLDVLGDLIGISPTNEVNDDRQEMIKNYNIFPKLSDWENKIMFFETSNEKMPPEHFKRIIQKLKTDKVFDMISGLVVGKPMDNAFYDEYKQILIEELSGYDFPVLYNANFGHGFPHAIIPILAEAEIDITQKTIKILNNTLA